MDNGHEENGIVLKEIRPRLDAVISHANPSFSMESDMAPPPYGPADGRHQPRNDEIPGSSPRLVQPSLSPTNIGVNGDTQKLDTLLSVEHTNVEVRKRHKSDGAMPNSPPSKTFLDPNNKKNSMYESKSTISGVKFDDSFIGKLYILFIL